jgi:hypothetical protein
MFETTNRIEVRYHSIELVPSKTLNLLVGIQSDTRRSDGSWDQAIWNNALPISESITRNLHGTTLIFEPALVSPSNSNSDDDLNGGEIAGIVIGIVAFVVIVILFILFCFKRRSTSKHAESETSTIHGKSVELPSQSRPGTTDPTDPMV